MSASSKTIEPKKFEKLSVSLLNVEFGDDEIAPTSQLYTGKIKLTTHLGCMLSVELRLTGTLIDVFYFILKCRSAPKWKS